MFYSLNNPWLPIPYNLKLSLIDPDAFTTIYALFFSRVMLGIGRAFNALIVFTVLYTLLTHYWKGFDWAAGWFLIPIGQASLYVFVVHLFYVLVMDNIPLFKENRLWVNALGETAVLLAIWLMIRWKFLFKIIPR